MKPVPLYQRLGALLVALASLLLMLPAAASAQGAPMGWIRLGHLSPGAPPVDIYFASFGGPEKAVIRKAGYGAVTPYSALPPGTYTVSMRPADAAASSPPVLSAAVPISTGVAYSMLIFETGANGALHGDVVTDDLSTPPSGSAHLRVVQGAAKPAPVTAAVQSGPTLGTDLAYGTTSPYATVPAGPVSVRLSAGGASYPANLTLGSGSITTLLVTQTAGGGLQANPITDDVSMQAPPKQGVETGGGGTAGDGTGLVPLLVAFGVGALAVLAVVTRRRARPSDRLRR